MHSAQCVAAAAAAGYGRSIGCCGLRQLLAARGAVDAGCLLQIQQQLLYDCWFPALCTCGICSWSMGAHQSLQELAFWL
jgi:hypothetical protein